MAVVEDALIVAGGLGTRMYPISTFLPKESLPLVDIPVLIHLAQEAKAAGVKTKGGFILTDNQMRTNVPHIFAIGDIVGQPMLAHKASHEGKLCAEIIAGNDKAEFDSMGIPSVAYTDPEVAWVGMTEKAAKEQNSKRYEHQIKKRRRKLLN